METFLIETSIAVSVLSFLTSVTALLIHYAKRGEHPLVTPLEAEIQSLKLANADVVDRLEHFVRRDRTRRLRAAQAEESDVSAPIPPPVPINSKAALRQLAKDRGLIR